MKFLSRFVVVMAVVVGLGYGSYAFGKYVLSDHLFGPKGANFRGKGGSGSPAADVEVLPTQQRASTGAQTATAPRVLDAPKRRAPATNPEDAPLATRPESGFDADQSAANREAFGQIPRDSDDDEGGVIDRSNRDSDSGNSDTRDSTSQESTSRRRRNDDSSSDSERTTRRRRSRSNSSERAASSDERETRPRVRRRRRRTVETQPTPRERRRVTQVQSRDETPARRSNRDEDSSPRTENVAPAPQIDAPRIEVEERPRRRRVEPRTETREEPRVVPRRRLERRDDAPDSTRPRRRRVEPREESPVPVPEGNAGGDDSPVPVAG